jgi:hypothetical protein
LSSFVRRSLARVRPIAAPAVTALAALLLWTDLVVPNQLSRVTFASMVRIPLEAVLLLVAAITLPQRARTVFAALFGALLGLLALLKAVDMGFYSELDRPFNPWTDWSYFGPAAGVVSDSLGQAGATVAVVAAIALCVALLASTVLAALRLTRVAARYRTRSAQAATALGVAWAVCAVLGAQIVGDTPIASTSASRLAFHHVEAIEQAIRDRHVFAEALGKDAFTEARPRDLLTELHGKDVLIAFVESYGRVAVEGSDFSPAVDAVLDAGTRSLAADGFASESAWLTSPTFGGISWLAHSTLQSGLWVDTQQRYDQLLDSDRLTLTGAFHRAGWRTVADVPSNDHDWPEGASFYHYDEVYDDHDVGYHGPRFSYATMPDQYTLAAFQRMELAAEDRGPVMAEIDLVSSHTPWAPLPHMIPWRSVGDGWVYLSQPAEGDSPTDVWRDSDLVREAYGQSIQYSMTALISFVKTYGDDDLVLIVLGDHQPSTIVSGDGASHDVPISIVAHDPSVMDDIADWGWQDGLRPGDAAPLWPMDAFRDRFLTAFGPRSAAAAASGAGR